MITPNQVLVAAKALSDSGTVTERFDTLDVMGTFTAAVFADWRSIATDTVLKDAISAIDAVGDPIEWTQERPDGEVRITFSKNQLDETCYFFTAAGLETLLKEKRIGTCRTVFIAEHFDEFNAESCVFRRWNYWNDLANWTYESKDTAPNKVVKDLGSFLVPVSAMPFLIAGAMPSDSDVFIAWKRCACENLFLCLVNEVWKEGTSLRVTLTGPRARKIDFVLSEVNPVRDFSNLTDVTNWVYGSRRDTELRHTFFTYELGRDWNDDLNLARGFHERAIYALDAARISFHAHISSSSKDTLKSLGDVRKSLADDVSKITQQTRELLSSLWKDFAIAVTALLGRIALSASGKMTDPVAMKGVLYGTALFLIASISVSLYMNGRFLALSGDSRLKWSEKLYGFLPPEDRQQLAAEPLEAAESLYKKIAWIIGVIYVSISGLLIYVA
jgi:hypothetical protein